MTPSDAEALQSAQAVFWIGHDMEAFLDKPLEALGIKAKIAALNKIKGLTTLPLREGGAFDAHEGEGEPAAEDHAHDHGEADPHLWLDPENAELMVKEIAATLSALDPANAAAYEINAKKTLTDLDALTVELAANLAPVKGEPFLTFHDAFQYFESRFGLSAAGSISVNPDTPPGAARIAELQAKVKSLGATCVFSEPNFEPKLINVVIEGTNAKTAALDPEASALPEGPDLYAQSLRGIAAAMRECLDS